MSSPSAPELARAAIEAVADGGEAAQRLVLECLTRVGASPDRKHDAAARAAARWVHSGTWKWPRQTRDTFVTAVSAAARGLLDALDALPPDPGPSPRVWDGALAAWIEGHASWGDVAGSTAEGVRRWSPARAEPSAQEASEDAIWSHWLLDDERASSAVLRTLANLVWRCEVEAGAVELHGRARRRQPGLNLAVVEAVSPALGLPLEPAEAAGRRFVRQAASRGVEVAGLMPVPGMVPGLDAALLAQHGIRLLQSIVAHRLLRWLVIESHRKALAGDPDPRVLTAAGWDGLAKDVGCRSKKDAATIRDVALALATMLFHLPGGDCTLLSLSHFHASGPGRRPEVEITVGTPLMPHFGRGGSERRVVPLTDLAPFVGNRRDYGRLANFQLQILAEMRRKAVEAVERGGILIRAADWTRIARTTGLVPTARARAVERWARDDDDGPAFLTRVERERYALAPAHADAWAFLLEGGRRSVDGRDRGRRSVARKGKRRR